LKSNPPVTPAWTIDARVNTPLDARLTPAGKLAPEGSTENVPPGSTFAGNVPFRSMERLAPATNVTALGDPKTTTCGRGGAVGGLLIDVVEAIEVAARESTPP
jgi:hypothetical protein